MILAMTNDHVLKLDGGTLTIDPESPKLRRRFDSLALRVRDSVDEGGMIAEFTRKPETPGERMRAFVADIKADVIVDDGDG